MEVQGSRGGANRSRQEIGRFDQEFRGGGRDLGVRAAHHTAHGDRPLGIRDHADAGLQRIGLVIDREERFVGPRLADHDPALAEPRQIEGMQRLAAFQQHVVRNVDHVVDHRDPDRAEAFGEPLGTGPDPAATNHARDVAGAKRRRLDGDRSQPSDGRIAGRRCRGGNAQAAIPQHGHFPRDAEMPETVRTIARDFQINAKIAGHLGGRLVVQPRHHQAMAKLRWRHIKRHVVVQPVP